MQLNLKLALSGYSGATDWISTIGPRQSLLLWRSTAWLSQFDTLLDLARNDDPLGNLSRLLVAFAREAVFDGETLVLEPEQAERFNGAGAVEHAINDDLTIFCQPQDLPAVTSSVLAIAQSAGYDGGTMGLRLRRT